MRKSNYDWSKICLISQLNNNCASILSLNLDYVNLWFIIVYVSKQGCPIE